MHVTAGARTVTMLLRDWRAGDRGALDELMPRIYAELRKLAARSLNREKAGHTLRPTDLVSEAYLKLSADGVPELADRVHFFAIAARTMRQLLVDHARKAGAVKRGNGERAAPIDGIAIPVERPVELVELDGALAALAKHDERKARVVELSYFGGLTQDEIAQVLEVSPATVTRDLRFAEAWIRRELA